MKTWSELGFEIETTEDGSLSLRLINPPEPLPNDPPPDPGRPERTRGESMHHSGGANSETNLIYGQPIAEILRQVPQPRFMVVGLGLGYIELNIAREALRSGRLPSSLAGITSYESVPELREYFVSWLYGEASKLHPEVQATYDKVAHDVLSESGVGLESLKSFLRHFFLDPSSISGALTPGTEFPQKYHAILYDAFSAKTNPFLWDEEFLRKLLFGAAADICLFSTYASRSGLKKALQSTGFEVVTRPGFKGKRNSTLGIKQISLAK